MALALEKLFEAPSVEKFEVGDGTLNLLFSWGEPRVVFCSHIDTVPPYVAPSFVDEGGKPCGPMEAFKVLGRGSCDAKGQVFAMYEACKELEKAGESGFGLLLLSGEETGSWGAKAFAKTGFRAPYLIVGEPTEGKMVSASKGTKSYDLRFRGQAFHSGYPERGVSAVDLFRKLMEALDRERFDTDPELGETTWNVGFLRSDNPQNILSPELTCRLYFRTTFSTDSRVEEFMAGAPALLGGRLEVSARGGDSPARYMTVPGLPSAPASFGSDAPHLTGFGHKAILGGGSINFAHRDDEQVLVSELKKQAEDCVYIWNYLKDKQQI